MSKKRRQFESIYDKLSKMLPRLWSATDELDEADVINTVRAINRLLRKAGLDLHDVVALMGEQKDPLLEMLKRLLEKDQDALVRLGRAGAKFFCSGVGEAFADISVDGTRITWPLSGPEFTEWLVHEFYLNKGKAPSGTSINNALRTLRAHARFEGDRHEVFLRIAEADGKIYLDIGDPEWHIVEIDIDGWRVVNRAPVRFRRTAGMGALPLPQCGGSIEQLRRFVNLGEAEFVLFVNVIVDALRPGMPHPVSYFAGGEGSAKSSAAKIIRSLVDPSEVPLSTLPGTVRELFVNVHGAQMLAFDNVSSISASISDALCQIASGSGIVMRRLYTDTGLVHIGGSRSIVLTGLLNAITRSDLADRAVIMNLPFIKPEERRPEGEFWREFGLERPRILGALLDIVVHGLKRLPHVRPPQLPRMADFVQWGIACEGAYAERGSFITALGASSTEAVNEVVENDPVATAVTAFMEGQINWKGTVTELLHELSQRDRAEAQPSTWKTWPKDPPSFGKALHSVKETLRRSGVEVTFRKAVNRKRTREVVLRRITEEPQPQAAAITSEEDTAGSVDGTGGADGSRAVRNVVSLRGN